MYELTQFPSATYNVSMPASDELPLNAPAPASAAPPVEQLQFRRAEPIASPAQHCVGCQGPIAESYYHASGRVVCPACAARVQQGQQQPPAHSFPRALLFGGAA